MKRQLIYLSICLLCLKTTFAYDNTSICHAYRHAVLTSSDWPYQMPMQDYASICSPDDPPTYHRPMFRKPSCKAHYLVATLVEKTENMCEFEQYKFENPIGLKLPNIPPIDCDLSVGSVAILKSSGTQMYMANGDISCRVLTYTVFSKL